MYLIKTLQKYMSTSYLNDKNKNKVIFLFNKESENNTYINNISISLSNIDINKLLNTVNNKSIIISKEDEYTMKVNEISSNIRNNSINITILDNTKKDDIDNFIRTIYSM